MKLLPGERAATISTMGIDATGKTTNAKQEKSNALYIWMRKIVLFNAVCGKMDYALNPTALKKGQRMIAKQPRTVIFNSW